MTAEYKELFVSQEGLCYLVSYGNFEDVKQLVEKGCEVNQFEDGLQGNLSPLMCAARDNKIQVAKYLIEKKANIKEYSQESVYCSTRSAGYSALSFAIENGHLEMMKLLLEHYDHIDEIIANFGATSLSIAAGLGNNIEAMDYLIGIGANVNAKAEKDLTPLRLAVGNGAFYFNEQKDLMTLIQMLYDKGADFNVIDDEGKTALKIAKEWKDRKVIRLVRKLSKSQK